MGETDDLREAINELRALAEIQQAEIGAQRAEIEHLKAELQGGPTPSVSQHGSADLYETPRGRRTGHMSRAGLLKAAAAGAAGIAGGRLVHPLTAAAADGQPIILGSGATNDSATGTTLISTSGTNPTTLLTVDDTNGGGNALRALAGPGTAVWGQSTGGLGVLGSSVNGVGVQAASTNGIDLVVGGIGGSPGTILLTAHSANVPPGSGSHSAGELMLDSQGKLWVCTYNGTPGEWSPVFLVDATVNFTRNGVTLVPDGSVQGSITLFKALGIPNGPNVKASGLLGAGANGGVGVTGVANGSADIGVLGQSQAGTAVAGESEKAPDLAAQGTGRFLQKPQSSAGAPTSGAYTAGEQVVDNTGTLYICSTGDGSGVGSWQAVGNMRFLGTPRRVFAQPMTNNTTTGPVDATARLNGGASGVPAGAQAAYCAVMADQPGVMTVFPDLATDPKIANWAKDGNAGWLSLTHMLVPLSPAGAFRIHSYLSGNVYVDVWGYLL